MVYCSHCGQANPDGSQFCNRCGHPLGTTTGPDIDRRLKDFGEEIGTVGKRFGDGISKEASAAETGFDRTFGFIGPLVKAIIAFVILVIVAQWLNVIGDHEPFIESIVQKVLLPYLAAYLVLFVFIAYAGYVSRKGIDGHQYLEPLTSAVVAGLVLWVALRTLGLAGAYYGINWLSWTTDATWVILPLVFLLILLLGYASLLAREQATRASRTQQAAPLNIYQVGEPKRLHRSAKDRMLGGVCAGLAEYFNTDVSVMRIIWVLLLVVSFGTVLLAYLILWIVIPRDPQGQW